MAVQEHPRVIVLAGPNGAGKSTAAPFLLHSALRVSEFVNADVIAQGLSAFNPENAAMEAGRVMLERLRALADAREDFAFETTLASRSFAKWIAGLLQTGYEFHLFFFYLNDAEWAVQRVSRRVQLGGHSVPEDMIRRRYQRGLHNLFNLYIPLTTTWRIYDNMREDGPHLIA